MAKARNMMPMMNPKLKRLRSDFERVCPRIEIVR